MITTLLVIKERAREIFSRYDCYIIPFLKFLVVFAASMIVNSSVGFRDVLSNPFAALLLAVVSAFLPPNLIAVLMALVLLGQFSAVSLELTLIVGVLILILFLLYFRFSPHDGMVLILTPLAFFCRVPYLVPLLVGATLTPASVVSVGFGVFLYYAISYVHINSAGINGANTDILTNATNYAAGILNNQEMFVVILIFAVMILMVWLMRRLPIAYGGQLAIGVAVLFELIAFIVVALVLKEGPALTGVIIETIICAVLALVIQFVLLPLDYSRTETVQFEDDDYYYYVKAVPKYSVTTPEVNVKHINAQKAKNGRNER